MGGAQRSAEHPEVNKTKLSQKDKQNSEATIDEQADQKPNFDTNGINNDKSCQDVTQGKTAKLADSISSIRKKKDVAERKLQKEWSKLAEGKVELKSLKCAIKQKEKKIEGLKLKREKQRKMLPKVHTSIVAIKSSFTLSNMQRHMQRMEAKQCRRDRNILCLRNEIYQLGRQVFLLTETNKPVRFPPVKEELWDPVEDYPKQLLYYPKNNEGQFTRLSQSTSDCISKSQSLPSLTENSHIAPSVSLTSCSLSNIIY